MRWARKTGAGRARARGGSGKDRAGRGGKRRGGAGTVARAAGRALRKEDTRWEKLKNIDAKFLMRRRPAPPSATFDGNHARARRCASPHEVDGHPVSASMVLLCHSAPAWRFLSAFVSWLPPRANFSVVGALPLESRIFTPLLQVGSHSALIFYPNATSALIYSRCMLHQRVYVAIEYRRAPRSIGNGT